jgi:hypothetical protein
MMILVITSNKATMRPLVCENPLIHSLGCKVSLLSSLWHLDCSFQSREEGIWIPPDTNPRFSVRFRRDAFGSRRGHARPTP